MVNRLPPSRGDLVEIAPGTEETRNIACQIPWLPKNGEEYIVKANGGWRAVWGKPASDVTDAEMESMSGPDVLEGEYKSEPVSVRLPTSS